jgi:hypothetical protein
MSKIIVALCLTTIILISTAASSWFLLPRHEGNKPKAKSLVTFDVDRFSDPKDKNSAVRGGWYVNITATMAKISFDQIVVVVYGPDMQSPINWSWLILEPTFLNESDGSVVYAQDSRIIYSDSPIRDELVNVSKGELDNLSGDLRSYDHMSMVYRDVQNDHLMNAGDSFFVYRDNDADGRVEVPSGSIFTMFVYHENDIHFNKRIFMTNLTLTWPTTCGVNGLIC